MKVLICSDSHGNPENIRRIIQAEQPDHLLFLGDGERDLVMAQFDFPDLPCHAVAGNCDYTDNNPDEAFIQLEGVNVLMAHGHRYGVKSSYERYFRRGILRRAKLICAGHTHTALIREKFGITLINPGSIGFYFDPTYAIAELKDGKILRTELRRLEAPVFSE